MVRLRDVLRAHGLDPTNTIAIRTDLHPDDASSDFRTIDDVLRAGVLPMYDRMQDGPRIGDGADVLSFVATQHGQARLIAFRRFSLRASGNVPGDIVYDYDGAHLLHSFIARAASPMFYDAQELSALDDLVGHLEVRWPEPMAANILPANDERLMVISARCH
jgi:hypothetical protein